jgi:hypothetical protein
MTKMKKSNILLLSALGVALIAIIILLFSVRSFVSANIIKGDGNITEQFRDIENFEKIKIRGNYKVHFTQDSVLELRLITDSNLHEYVKTIVRNNELIIESKESIMSGKDINVKLSNLFITEIEATAAAHFTTVNELNLPELKLLASAGARIDITGFFENLTAIQNAGARIVLSGKADRLKLESNAGGNIDAFELEAGYADVEANAGASVNVNARELEARASAGGTINYTGNPVLFGISTTAGGSIRQRN